MWTWQGCGAGPGRGSQGVTHLLLLGPLVSGAGALAALLFDGHYEGPVLARSLASRGPWGHGTPGSRPTPEASPHTHAFTSGGWRPRKCVEAHLSPGKGSSGDPAFEGHRRPLWEQPKDFKLGTGWVWGRPEAWEQDEVVREATGGPSNSGASTDPRARNLRTVAGVPGVGIRQLRGRDSTRPRLPQQGHPGERQGTLRGTGGWGQACPGALGVDTGHVWSALIGDRAFLEFHGSGDRACPVPVPGGGDGYVQGLGGADGACLGGSRGEDLACVGVPEDGDGACPGVPREGTGWGEAHSRGGPAWLPGAVGHGLSGRDLERRAAEVRGVPPATPMGTPGRCPGRPGEEEADPGAGRSSGGRPRDPLLRDRVPEAAPRAPQPPPRAGPDFPALFTSEKTFPGPGMRRRSNQAPAAAPPIC